MYQVIKMHGDVEPWWFLDGWEDDIIEVSEFDDYYEALKYYKEEWRRLYQKMPSFISKSSVMTAFWDQDDKEWCEECDDYLQQFHSLLLLTDWHKIPKKWYRPGYDRRNDHPHHKPACPLISK